MISRSYDLYRSQELLRNGYEEDTTMSVEQTPNTYNAADEYDDDEQSEDEIIEIGEPNLTMVKVVNLHEHINSCDISQY